MRSSTALHRSPVLSLRPCRRQPRSHCRAVPSRVLRTRVVKAQAAADAATLLLDCDGVLADTEAEGHRVSFNEAFKQRGELDQVGSIETCYASMLERCARHEHAGLDFAWTVEEYGNLLAIGGGKERMSHYFTVRLLFDPRHL